MTNNFKGMLGLCRKAGKLILGYDNIEKNKKNCVLLIVSCDLSERTKRNSEKFAVPVLYTDMTKTELGLLFGNGDVAVCGVTDVNFAAALQKKY